MFLIKNITTHNFQNRNATLDGAAQTVCELKHLYEIYLQSFMFQIKRDKKYCVSQLSKWKHLDCSKTSQLCKVRLRINKYLQICRKICLKSIAATSKRSASASHVVLRHKSLNFLLNSPQITFTHFNVLFRPVLTITVSCSFESIDRLFVKRSCFLVT